jgi:hypothetical protein
MMIKLMRIVEEAWVYKHNKANIEVNRLEFRKSLIDASLAQVPEEQRSKWQQVVFEEMSKISITDDELQEFLASTSTTLS